MALKHFEFVEQFMMKTFVLTLTQFEKVGSIAETFISLFEFVEQFMMKTFSLNLIQFEKTGSIGEIYISLGNLIINFHFRN